MVRVAFIVCAGSSCGNVLTGQIHEDGEIVPVGVGKCPNCGGSSWTELDMSD